MKFLLFGALLIGSTLCQSTPHRYEELIGKLNFERRLFAERMNISNMYELHWDEKLNPILWPEYRSPNSSFREMLIGRDQNAIASEVYVLDQLLIEIHNDSGRERFWEIMNVSIDSNRWPYWPFEHFLPTQTSIACDSRENMYRWESPWKGSNLYRTICYLGPEREYAKAMNISNMYKLKWNKVLKKANENSDSSLVPNFQKFYGPGNEDAFCYESHALNDSQ
ncbi:Protein CBG22641 [Caenorhabditis briggsae]|uniref:Uncharacterized protein n=2 Tax=Caenorhabditis briggsae TaxID=6238 RepID=A0AAE9AC67_CAEBR|nr:Protein CBG22641 [Caenorhabditis briggsae]ULT91797.1 hypothetical protein L3Y34_009459 [Caenorhabditis briggsae]CAP39191.2 Protein CBG22641 [Caenorhabditis briggsae]